MNYTLSQFYTKTNKQYSKLKTAQCGNMRFKAKTLLDHHTSPLASYTGMFQFGGGPEEECLAGAHCGAHAFNFRGISEIGHPGNFPCNGDVTIVEFLQLQYSLV